MYLYFITSKSNRHLTDVKVGISKDPARRLQELQTSNSSEQALVGTIKAKSPMHARALEKHWHKLLGIVRLRGEWFKYTRPTAKLIEAFCSGTSVEQEEALKNFKLYQIKKLIGPNTQAKAAGLSPVEAHTAVETALH